jgi:zinc/manganese transport system permease protein
MFSAFMVNTWIAASMVAVAAGLAGFFVVVRGSTFAAHALPLGIFPGAAAAGFFGVNPFWGLMGFAALGVWLLSRLARRQRNDVATALTLIMMLGLGALFLSLSGQYAPSVFSLLFGEVLGVATDDLMPLAAATAAVIVLTSVFFRPLLLSAVSPDLGAAQQLDHGRLEILFLAIIALATAMALPIVGALLVFSLMVGPPAAVRALTARPQVAMALSAALALITVWAAIALSYVTNWPVGFFVGTLAAGCYGVGRLAKTSAAFLLLRAGGAGAV